VRNRQCGGVLGESHQAGSLSPRGVLQFSCVFCQPHNNRFIPRVPETPRPFELIGQLAELILSMLKVGRGTHSKGYCDRPLFGPVITDVSQTCYHVLVLDLRAGKQAIPSAIPGQLGMLHTRFGRAQVDGFSQHP
jgi:hypothetical protein